MCVCVCVYPHTFLPTLYICIYINTYCIALMIIIIIVIQAEFSGLFFYDTRRDTQFIKAYANHSMSTPHSHTAHLVVSKISIHLCQLRPKLIWFDKIRKTQLLVSTIVPQLFVFFTILKFSGHLFRAWYLPTQFTPTARPVSFYDWEFIIADDDCHILSARADVQVLCLTTTYEPRDTQ